MISSTWVAFAYDIYLDLSAAVDVYSDWVDACDAVAKDTATKYEDNDPRVRPSNDFATSPSARDVGFEEADRNDTYADEYWLWT